MPKIYVILFIILFTALIAAFTILLTGKLGIRDSIILKAPKLISKLFQCDFCLSFWISQVLCIYFAIVLQDINILFIPILSTPITRVLI